ncbi:fluoride efflux transporter FluC [Prauserella muralis]|uniref:Fluoride-specific ion channel FluC n=1 Tax=Prauserella muralis TaxID=588067 RepID=A0A2V4B2I0_9PSEU|nr:CrcB family protein [Prauserella muralis]PXY28481.1 chromosome condensation protein CrcB [Prauserella muralis]TWE21964.1 CrcB protein [Prauserella muralis]
MPRTRQWDVLLAIAAGGALGSLARYGLAVGLPHPPGGFAVSTLLANVLGCVLIGVLMVVVTEVARPRRLLRPFAGVGFCGGFTTFSTYVVDAMDSALQGRPGVALLYALGSVLASLTAVLAGIVAARLLLRPRRAGHARARQRQPGGV